MNTKELIIEEALKLFSTKGYTSVTVEMIADKCSIKAPSLYKHFKSKKEIFNAVYEKAIKKYDKFISSIAISDSEISSINPEILFSKLKLVINFLTQDEEIVMLRKLMKLSSDQKIKDEYSVKFFDSIINYHKRLFSSLIDAKIMKAEDPLTLAMLYDSPVLVIIDELDRHPNRQEEMLEILKKHIQLFFSYVTKK